MNQEYREFLSRKGQLSGEYGFTPLWLPDCLFDFQRHLVEWALRRGRAAIFADCGLGKSLMQLVWSENVLRKTGRPILILTPLAVSQQTEREAGKFGIEAYRSQDGRHRGGIVIANYERLHHFRPDDFAGVVCDESSILKNLGGSLRKRITRFLSKMPYRLLCTATAAPNDYVELGTSSEALGELSYSDMLRRFFQQLDDKGQKRERLAQERAEFIVAHDPSYFQKLAYRVSQTIGQWRLKHHAVVPFWRWVSSWARACRSPADLGFDGSRFVLPELTEHEHVITPRTPPPGFLFTVPAVGMGQEREERRRTLTERTEFVASLVDHDRPAVVWCHLNEEGNRLEQIIPGARQVAGRTPDERKVELYEAFARGDLRVLITKPKIGGWGLNWQHCAHVVAYVSHSYEQDYQCIRRCYRFGQERPVRVDRVATEGEVRVLGNLRRKAQKADAMFAALIREMNSAVRLTRTNDHTGSVEVPSWLFQSN